MDEPCDPPTFCALCAEPITKDNDSREHVIPNSIGGRLKVRGFICVDCNNSAGDGWDASLARQLNFLCLFFGIVRDRGVSPPELIETTTGERLFLQPGGGLQPEKPTFSKAVTDEGVQVTLTARSKYEARKMLKGIKRKHPHIDVDALLASMSPSFSYAQGLVNMKVEFGGELSGRSVVKTAAAIAHHAGIPSTACDLALAYLRDPHASACFGYYYDKDVVAGRPAGIPLHCAAVSGDPETGLLLGYVEYFGVQRMVICLSETYSGPRIEHVYGINPLTGEDLPLSVTLALSVDDVRSIYAYECVPAGAVERAYSDVIPPAMRRQFEGEKSRAISQAVDYAFKNCGANEGETLSEDQVRKLSGLITDRLTPFILHNLRRR